MLEGVILSSIGSLSSLSIGSVGAASRGSCFCFLRSSAWAFVTAVQVSCVIWQNCPQTQIVEGRLLKRYSLLPNLIDGPITRELADLVTGHCDGWFLNQPSSNGIMVSSGSCFSLKQRQQHCEAFWCIHVRPVSTEAKVTGGTVG